MKRFLYLLLLVLLMPALGSAREAWRGWCEIGGAHVITSGLSSTTTVQKSATSCLVTVYTHGGGLAQLYSDNNGTVLANPFTADATTGSWIFYADNGRYDVTTSSTGLGNPVTYSDILLCDPLIMGSVCGNGSGGVSSINIYKNNTLVGTEPGVDFVEGNGITIDPATDDPPNGRVHLTINATASGSGCTLPGTDTGVVSEHPVGTCYDSDDFTWDDTSNVNNLQAGDGTNAIGADNTENFIFGPGNTTLSTPSTKSASNVGILGDFNTIGASTNANEFFVIGSVNSVTNTHGSSFTMGITNNISDAGDNIYTIGTDNTVQSGTPGTNVNIDDCYIIGEDSNVSHTPGGHTLDSCMLLGFGNTIVNTSAGSIDSLFLAGELNHITSSVHGVDSVHILGIFNSVEDTLAHTSEVEIVGERNDIDGSISTAQIFGFRNIAHNVSAQGIAHVNTVIVGSANTATNTGASGDPAYMDMFGHSMNLHDCKNCLAIGSTVEVATSDFMGIGMSAVPEIVVKANQISISTLAAAASNPLCYDTTTLASYKTFADCSAGSRRRTCMIIIGADNGSALADADIGPQADQCFVDAAGTLIEVGVVADAGTPTSLPSRDRLGTVVNLLSGALTAGAGTANYKCSNVGATTSINGTTTCSGTLQNTALLAGDYINVLSGTAGGTAKKLSIQVTWQVN